MIADVCSHRELIVTLRRQIPSKLAQYSALLALFTPSLLAFYYDRIAFQAVSG